MCAHVWKSEVDASVAYIPGSHSHGRGVLGSTPEWLSGVQQRHSIPPVQYI